MSNKYFTVVFEITDKDAFQENLSQFTGSMMDEHEFPGANVTGCGWGDFMREAEAYMEELIANNIDLPEIVE